MISVSRSGSCRTSSKAVNNHLSPHMMHHDASYEVTAQLCLCKYKSMGASSSLFMAQELSLGPRQPACLGWIPVFELQYIHYPYIQTHVLIYKAVAEAGGNYNYLFRIRCIHSCDCHPASSCDNFLQQRWLHIHVGTSAPATLS